MGRHRSISNNQRNQNEYEMTVLRLGYYTSIATFAATLIAFIIGSVVYFDSIGNIEEKAKIVLEKIENYKEKSSEYFETIDKNVQPVVGINFTDIISFGISGEYKEKAISIAKREESNNVRRADAILEFSKENYEKSLFLWENILEYDKQAPDAIFYCNIISLILANEKKSVAPILEGKKYLKEIPEKSIEGVFAFLDYLFNSINYMHWSKKDVDSILSHIDWVYRTVEKTKRDFQLYHKWAAFLTSIYNRQLPKDVFLLRRVLNYCDMAENFLKEDATIPERSRIDFYLIYSNANILMAHISPKDAAANWDNALKIFEKIKDTNEQCKLRYALFLRDKNAFYGDFSEESLRECLNILTELKNSYVRGSALKELGDIYYKLYAAKKNDIELLIKAEENIRATISFTAENIFNIQKLLDVLYTITSQVDDKKKYFARVDFLFSELEKKFLMTAELFEYKIKFMLLEGKPEKDIVMAFLNYHGPISHAMLSNPEYKKFLKIIYSNVYSQTIDEDIEKL